MLQLKWLSVSLSPITMIRVAAVWGRRSERRSEELVVLRLFFVVIILQTEIISDLVSSQLHYEVHCQLFIETMFVSIRLIPVMSIWFQNHQRARLMQGQVRCSKERRLTEACCTSVTLGFWLLTATVMFQRLKTQMLYSTILIFCPMLLEGGMVAVMEVEVVPE